MIIVLFFMKKKVFIFDIDNTICTTKKNFYKSSRPKKKIVNLINNLKDKGHIVKIFTSRYMGRNNEKTSIVKKKYYQETYKYLKKWNIKFDKLIMGKPSYDYFIDDKCLNIKSKKTIDLLKAFNE